MKILLCGAAMLAVGIGITAVRNNSAPPFSLPEPARASEPIPAPPAPSETQAEPSTALVTRATFKEAYDGAVDTVRLAAIANECGRRDDILFRKIVILGRALIMKEGDILWGWQSAEFAKRYKAFLAAQVKAEKIGRKEAPDMCFALDMAGSLPILDKIAAHWPPTP